MIMKITEFAVIIDARATLALAYGDGARFARLRNLQRLCDAYPDVVQRRLDDMIWLFANDEAKEGFGPPPPPPTLREEELPPTVRP